MSTGTQGCDLWNRVFAGIWMLELLTERRDLAVCLSWVGEANYAVYTFISSGLGEKYLSCLDCFGDLEWWGLLSQSLVVNSDLNSGLEILVTVCSLSWNPLSHTEIYLANQRWNWVGGSGLHLELEVGSWMWAWVWWKLRGVKGNWEADLGWAEWNTASEMVTPWGGVSWVNPDVAAS